jgi:hypothetical protein
MKKYQVQKDFSSVKENSSGISTKLTHQGTTPQSKGGVFQGTIRGQTEDKYKASAVGNLVERSLVQKVLKESSPFGRWYGFDSVKMKSCGSMFVYLVFSLFFPKGKKEKPKELLPVLD